jgi:hypothetical protein
MYDSPLLLTLSLAHGIDIRLQVLNPQWFEGKNVLDIGCNKGLVSVGAGNDRETETETDRDRPRQRQERERERERMAKEGEEELRT